MADQTLDPTLEASAEQVEPLDRGEASEKVTQQPSPESQPNPEIISPPSAESMKRWKVFADKIVSCGVISTDEYENFASEELQDQHSDFITNKERRKRIDEIEQASTDPDISVEEKAQLKTELKNLQVEQAYSDFFFMRLNIKRLRETVDQELSAATSSTEEMEAHITRLHILRELSNVFIHYRSYMSSIPELIDDFITDDKFANEAKIVELNLKLYTQLDREKMDMSTQAEAQSNILNNFSVQETSVSPDKIDVEIETEERNIELIKQRMVNENKAALESPTVTNPTTEAAGEQTTEVAQVPENPPQANESTQPQEAAEAANIPDEAQEIPGSNNRVTFEETTPENQVVPPEEEKQII